MAQGAGVSYPPAAEQYELLSQVGKGATANVFKGRCLAAEVAEGGFAPPHVAVKIVNFDESRFEVKQFQLEIAMMSGSNHPNIAKLHASFTERNQLWLILDFFPYGSVADALKASARKGVVGLQHEEKVLASILYQTCVGLSYFHELNQMHRDVKAANLLLREDGLIAMADFGVSAEAPQQRQSINRKTFVGTPCWIAPEVITMRGYRRSADIWSVGITAFELAFGHPPYANQPPMKVMALTLRHDPPTPDRLHPNNTLSAEFKDFVNKALQKDPAARPSAAELLQHPLFAWVDSPDTAVRAVEAGLHAMHIPTLREAEVPVDLWSAEPAQGTLWDFPSMGYFEAPEAPAPSPRALGYVPKMTPSGAAVSLHEAGVDVVLCNGQPAVDDAAAEIVLALQHDGLLSCNEVWENGAGKLYWATASKTGGLLSDVLAAGAMPFEDVKKSGAVLADGIRVLHKTGHAHRRISDHSVYVVEGVLKLDCVLSILFPGATPPWLTVVDPSKRGSENYLAPEQYDDAFDQRVDVYSFGLLLVHMLTGRTPYEEMCNPMKVMLLKQKGSLPPGIEQAPPAFKDLIQRCLEPDPAKRIAIEDATAHPCWST
eukprot:TRINITY_DN30720_c0_g1_i1.p1 TRINITY_DN30720_c0_g1~~TRINITY_DN30720_c0_g1_i1.p1  ORF type:complete len:601 (+),score=207.64 TRINITY_DN30720_c0_g1_i1:73-1875(+)